jgi:uncharacterized membrane protein YbhN (UPF0104 family)
MTRLRWLLLLAGSALFALFLWQLDLESAAEALRDAEPWALASALLLNVVLIALFGLRSHLVLLRLGHRLPLSLVVPIALVGNVAGALTPAASGEALRAAALSAHADVPVRDSVALVFFERGVSLYLLIVGTLAGAAWLALPAAWAVAAYAGLLAGVLALPVVAPPLLRALLSPLDEEVPPAGIGRILAPVRGAAGRLAMLLADWPLFIRWSLLTYAIFGVFSLQIWLLARSMTPDISAIEAWLALAVSQLATIASLVPMGVGVQDSSMAALLDRFGMTLEQGAAVALLVRVTVTAPCIIAAFGCYAWLVRRAPRENAGPPLEQAAV